MHISALQVKAKSASSPSETKKTPFKSKITKIKPISRNKKQEDLGWFDSDAIFGFGFEDD